MDFLDRVPDAIEAGFVAWAALRLEIAYRRWRAARMIAKRKALIRPAPEVLPIAHIKGAVGPVVCDHCGLAVRDYTIYTDDSIKCDACREE